MHHNETIWLPHQAALYLSASSDILAFESNHASPWKFPSRAPICSLDGENKTLTAFIEKLWAERGFFFSQCTILSFISAYKSPVHSRDEAHLWTIAQFAIYSSICNLFDICQALIFFIRLFHRHIVEKQKSIWLRWHFAENKLCLHFTALEWSTSPWHYCQKKLSNKTGIN